MIIREKKKEGEGRRNSRTVTEEKDGRHEGNIKIYPRDMSQ